MSIKDELIKIKKNLLKQKNDQYIPKELHQYTEEEIQDIHDRGKLTQYEALEEINSLGVCVPGDAIGSARWRCRLFKDCNKCLEDYVSSKLEYNSIIQSFKVTNSIDFDNIDKYIFTKKLDR